MIPERATLATLIAKLTELEENDGDPGVVDLAQLLGDLRGKTDGIKFVLDKLGNYQDFLSQQIEPLRKAKASAAKHAERLREYVRTTMEASNFEKLPGEVWNMRLQRNPKASMQFKREPDAVDYTEYPGLVTLDRVYSWNKDGIERELIMKGRLDHLPFVEIWHGKHVRFDLNKDSVPATQDSPKTKRQRSKNA